MPIPSVKPEITTSASLAHPKSTTQSITSNLITDYAAMADAHHQDVSDADVALINGQCQQQDKRQCIRPKLWIYIPHYPGEKSLKKSA
ncbi:hypothetical protein [Trichothermofontia sp.]